MARKKDTFQATFLGAFTLRRGGTALDLQRFHSRQTIRLLAFLIYYRGTSYPVEKLYETLWEDGADDPVHALTNLIYRLRKTLQEFWPGEKLIVSVKGVYQWNPACPLTADTDMLEHFGELYRTAGEPAGSKKAEDSLLAAAQNAAACYHDRFLMDFAGDADMYSLRSYYHDLYLNAVDCLIGKCEEEHDYTEMERLCQKAIQIDPAEERLYCGLLRAYTGQNRYAAAEQSFRQASEKLQEKTGNAPAGELVLLYRKMQQQIHARETDLDRVISDLAQENPGKQAFLCEYGFFQKLFLLRARLMEREGSKISIILLTLGGEENTETSEMKRLQEILVTALRNSDVVTRFSASQYLLMLSGCSKEQAEPVMERILKQYYAGTAGEKQQLSYHIRELSAL